MRVDVLTVRLASTILEMIPGVALIMAGEIWLLQGLGKLPGSFMTRSSFWAVVGAVTMLIGFALLVGVASRHRRGA